MDKLKEIENIIKIHEQSLQDKFCTYFIDVGQGDSILLKGDQLILIEGGDYATQNAKKILSILERNDKKLGDLDIMIVTHPDKDHYGGLLLLLRADQKINSNTGIAPFALEFTERYDGNQERDVGPLLKDFMNRWADPGFASENKVLWRDKKIINISDNVQMETLFPIQNQHIQQEDVIKLPEIYANYQEELEIAQEKGLNKLDHPESLHNANSLVFRISYDQFSILLTGDAEATTEYMLWEDYEDGLKSDIVKISHHGGAYSSIPQFVQATNPIVAIAPTDSEKNSHGHPSEWALDIYENQESNVYRTDLDGTIEICSDGKSFLVETDGSRYDHGYKDSHMFVILNDELSYINFTLEHSMGNNFDPLMQIKQMSYDEENKTILIEFSESDFEGNIIYTISNTLLNDIQVIGSEGVVGYEILDDNEDEISILVKHESGDDTTIIKGT